MGQQFTGLFNCRENAGRQKKQLKVSLQNHKNNSEIVFPRHPVIPPEVKGVLDRFWGSSHTFSGGVTGCLEGLWNKQSESCNQKLCSENGKNIQEIVDFNFQGKCFHIGIPTLFFTPIFCLSPFLIGSMALVYLPTWMFDLFMVSL